MDENLSPQEGMNPESEVIEETYEQQEETEQPKTYSEEEFKQVLARAKAAEAKLKTVATPKPITNAPSISEEDIEAKILRAQGVSDELLTEMKAIARVRGKSILEVQNDPILIAMKEQKEKEAAALKARLPASRGSGIAKKEKEFTTPGLSEEDHKAMWKERNSK